MLKPNFPKKEMEREKREVRKEMRRKKRKKNEKKGKEGFPIKRSEESKKEKIGGKQSNSRSMKEREQKIFRPDKFSAR